MGEQLGLRLLLVAGGSRDKVLSHLQLGGGGGLSPMIPCLGTAWNRPRDCSAVRRLHQGAGCVTVGGLRLLRASFSSICKMTIIVPCSGWAPWLMPVIPARWGSRRVDHLRSGVRDYPSQHRNTPSLLKIQKFTGMVAGTCNPSYSGG